jgi:hypothetical protein
LARARAATRAAALAVLALAGAWSVEARAEVKRYALLIGANRGHAHETPLRYAETDVGAVADTLSQLGGYVSEHVTRLIAPTPARVRSALMDVNLAIQAQVRAGHEAILFVYYSGHADAQSLHLGTSDLPSEELRKLVQLSPARLKVLLLDACRSGTVTRVKGGHQVAPFQIGVEDKLRFEGYAVITSSAAGEDAQESDALRSSIFTHHFLTALRGPGDFNRDRQVTLNEAYGYAYDQALKTSMTTVAGSQHATYDYDLRGRADPVITDLRAAADHGHLLLSSPGEYMVMSGEGASVLFEAAVTAPRTIVLLPPARYQVRLRTRSNVYHGEFALRPGQPTVVAESDLRPLPLAQVIRKGDVEATLAQGPSVVGLVHGPLGTGFSPMVGAQVGYAFELPRFTLMPRLGWSMGRSLSRDPDRVASHDVTELSLELTALYVFDWDWVSLAPLVSVGWGRLHHQVVLAGCSAGGPNCNFSARPNALITTVGGWAMVPLGRGFTLDAMLELANFYAKRQADPERTFDLDSPRFGKLTYRAGVGIGYRY